MFQVLTAATMKIAVSWEKGSCSLVEVERRFGSAYCFHHQGNDGGSTTSEMSSLLQRDYD
jgi:hypothetical protein